MRHTLPPVSMSWRDLHSRFRPVGADFPSLKPSIDAIGRHSGVESSHRTQNAPWNEAAAGIQLPVELLLKIFLLAAEEDLIEHLPDTDSSVLPCALSLSLVCRQWRSVSLACPKLWAIIPLWREEWVHVMAKNASNYPFTLQCTFHSCNQCVPSTRGIDAALAYAAKADSGGIEHISINWSTGQDGLAKRMPIVYDLLIRTSRLSPSTLKSISATAPVLELLSLGSLEEILVASSLTSLRLTRCFMDLNPHPTTKIATIILRDCGVWKSPTHMLSVLKRLPQLQLFSSTFADDNRSSVFWYENRWTEPVQNVEPRSISLPHVQKLRFEDIFEPVLFLLKYTALPSHADISLVSGYIPGTMHAQEVGIALSHHFDGCGDTELSAKIVFNGNPVVCLEFAVPSSGRLEWVLCGRRTTFSGTMHAARLYQLENTTFEGAAGVIHPPDYGLFVEMLRHVFISHRVSMLRLDSPPQEVVRPLLERFPYAKELSVDCTVSGLRSIMDTIGAVEGMTPKLVPRLSHLTIRVLGDGGLEVRPLVQELAGNIAQIQELRPGLVVDMTY